MTQEMIDFLKQNQWSGFYRSLLTQYERNGRLSDKQIACIQKALDKKIQVVDAATLEAKTPDFSLKTGQIIEVKAFVARRLKADLNMEYFFRNLEVMEVLAETPRAYQVKVKFVSKIVTSCHICGAELDTDVSRATGIGPVCAKRIGLQRPTLATAQETLKAIDALCSSVGTLGPVWVPKSQIKNIDSTENIPQVGG